MTKNPDYNINVTFNLQSKILKETINKHAPLRKMTRAEKRRLNKSWLTRGILISIKTRQKHYIDSLKLPILRDRYKKYRNLLKHVISLSKRNENRKKILLANNKSKAMLEVINTSLNKNPKGRKPKIRKLKTSSGETITDGEKMANQFNEYFVSVGTNMAKNIPNIPNIIHSPRKSQTIVFTDTNSNEVEDILNDLSPKKCIINADSPTKYLKIAAPVIAPILAIIFNNCLKNGIYPDALKIAQVIPIHKDGAKDICSNYRPISLLSQYNKIFEKIMHKRFYSFFEKYHILSQHQYGFRKSNSTALAIYDVVENLMKSKDKNEISCAVFLDLSKAFDTVDRNILLKNLKTTVSEAPL